MKNSKETCESCLFLRQEWAAVINKRGTTETSTGITFSLDTFCGLCGIFKKPEGFCDCWAEK